MTFIETNKSDFPDFASGGCDIFPDKSALNIKDENIYRALGMQESHADDYLKELISQMEKEARKMCEPKTHFIIIGGPYFNKDCYKLILKNVQFNIQKMVYAFLKKSSYIAVFVATIGDKVENFSKKLIKEGHTLEGLIVDILGSEFAEETAEIAHSEIRNTAEEKKLNVTNRYSPGYCNWPVDEQQKLFSLLDNTCGIHLTPSSLMVPVKSVSGIVGIGKDVKQLAYKCQLCSDEKCILRGRK